LKPLTLISSCREKVLNERPITADEAVELIKLENDWVPDLLAAASHIRRKYKGNSIKLCAIINAKAGCCAENCAFCAQSGHHQTNVQSHALLEPKKLLAGADEAAVMGAHLFGIVTSGTRINSPREWKTILSAITEIKCKNKIAPCTSLGILTPDQARELKEAGLQSYHHNLETARSFFPQICTTHDYEEDVQTVRNVKAAGLSTCSGGIFGLGESLEQRIELAMTLRDLEVDSVPMNFLNPIKGTPLENKGTVPPLEALKTVAVFRFLLPRQDLKLCGGKEVTFRQLLPMGLMAANSLMIGNYLTTAGRSPELDKEMIEDLGLDPKFA